MIIESRAYARAGLLGNPSDGYSGKTISIIVRNFGAHVSLYESPELVIEPQKEDLNVFRNIYDLVENVNLTGYYGGSRLVKAAIKKFSAYCTENNIRLKNKNFTIRYYSSLPRQVGLAGSSAIITATVRALMRFYQVEIDKPEIPNLVLSAEVDELGINAGLQDRVIQTYEGCTYMDFDPSYIKKHGFGLYEQLNPTHLPNLYIAYKTDLGKVSGGVFNDVRARYKKGDQQVIDTLNEIANCAEEGKEAIIKKDFQKLNELIDRNFDLRKLIMNISQSNIELINTARSCGASAKFTGSGGSIIGIYKDDEMLTKLVIDLKKIKARVIKPYIL
jgi:glucuronokinase